MISKINVNVKDRSPRQTLMLVIICARNENNPSKNVGATERTRPADQTDGQADGRGDRKAETDGQIEPNIPFVIGV